MIAVLVLLISMGMLVQFLASYVRSLLLAGAQQDISPLILETCHLASEEVAAADFHRLMLRVRLCPAREGDGGALFVIRMYYRLVGLFRVAFGPLVPLAKQWSAVQQAACARFALASLNRRLIAPASASS